ncbi:hypothetical protein [Roseateles asaccharophilus]|uniref:Uncharacterized protein n=1 Tax=Roseateles asaccharophilus TaxID=582607 RepID=A0ABU2A3T8_9BURK|nr:hypothetical protein [Roseateles asaccharophilus]MDR7331845.1 hypothetical protein [Roseateles asaccharophilus]
MNNARTTRAAWLLAAGLLAVPAWAGDDAKSFSIGFEGKERASLADLGLPAYPGATPYSESQGDKSAVTLGAWAGSFGLRVSAMKFQVADSPARVAAFYAQALKQHGTVLDCREPAARVKPPQGDKTERLSCEEGALPTGVYEFRVGTSKRFRVVKVTPHGDGARFDMARVALGN